MSRKYLNFVLEIPSSNFPFGFLVYGKSRYPPGITRNNPPLESYQNQLMLRSRHCRLPRSVQSARSQAVGSRAASRQASPTRCRQAGNNHLWRPRGAAVLLLLVGRRCAITQRAAAECPGGQHGHFRGQGTDRPSLSAQRLLSARCVVYLCAGNSNQRGLSEVLLLLVCTG